MRNNSMLKKSTTDPDKGLTIDIKRTNVLDHDENISKMNLPHF